MGKYKWYCKNCNFSSAKSRHIQEHMLNCNYISHDIKKITKDNVLNGLDRNESFKLEYNCLKILNDNFECICNLNCQHFPKIKSSNKKKCLFIFSNCGYSLNRYNFLVKKKKIKPIIPKNINQQIDCIIYNLIKSNIKHLDVDNSGKNICITEKGIISLIDFDIATIKDDFKSDIIKKLYDKKNYNDDYYNNLRNKLKSVIYSFFLK